MMKLKFLGTGNAGALKCYNTCFVIDDDGQFLLVDTGGGNGLLKSLKHFGLGINDFDHIFISHRHLDHLLGLFWLLRLSLGRFRKNENDHITIYGHDEVLSAVGDSMSLFFSAEECVLLKRGFCFAELKDGDVHLINGRHYHFFDIQSAKAKQFGFFVKTDGGRLCFLGDEPYRLCEAAYADHCAYLLHEAFCLDDEKDIFHPYAYFHNTVKDAAIIAEHLQADNLILYHTQDNCLTKRKELYRAEASAYYHGNIFVPDDLDVIELL